MTPMPAPRPSPIQRAAARWQGVAFVLTPETGAAEVRAIAAALGVALWNTQGRLYSEGRTGDAPRTLRLALYEFELEILAAMRAGEGMGACY